MRKIVLLTVIVISLIGLIIGGCTEPAQEPTPSPETSAPSSPQPTAAPEVIKLIVHCPNPPTAAPGQSMQAWVDKVTELYEGRIEITPYFAGSLFSQQEVIKSVLAGGVADIHFAYMAGEDPNLMPLNLFIDLPFLGWTDALTSHKIMMELMDNIPEMTEEFQGLKVLYMAVGPDQNWIMTTGKQVLTTDDMDGMKFIAHGYSAKWYEAVGATPVKLSFPEFYTSMEKGVVDGQIGALAPMMGAGMIELFKYSTHLPTPLTQGFFPAVMNPDSWNSLPPDMQKTFEDLGTWFAETHFEFANKSNLAGLNLAKEIGIPIVELSPEVTQEWKDIAKPVHEEWIEDVEAKGKPAKALYDELMRLLKENQ